MITKERWTHLVALNAEKEADQIEKECIDSQLEEGRRRVGGEACCFNVRDIAPQIVGILERRAQAAGWRVVLRDNWLSLLP